jgi:hypothetical protein
LHFFSLKRLASIRFIALIVSFFLLATDLHAYVQQPRSSLSFLSLQSDHFSKWGRVEEQFIPESYDKRKPYVYLIQDAHDSLEAQENIAAMIHFLVKKNNVSTVFEEGFEGKVPTDDYFKELNRKKKEAVSYFLLDQLRIGGAEYAHIHRQKDFDLIGIENKDLYFKNVKAYSRAIKKQKYILESLNTIEEKLLKVINKQLPSKFESWFSLHQQYEKNNISLDTYITRSKVAFTNAFDSKDFSEYFPALNSLTNQFEKQAQDVDYRDFILELKKLEHAYQETVFNTSTLDQANKYRQEIHLLEKLARLELSSEDYQLAKTQFLKINTQAMIDFVFREMNDSLVFSSGWEQHIQTAMAFYDLAEKRDHALKDHLIPKLKNLKKENAVLVSVGCFKRSFLNL